MNELSFIDSLFNDMMGNTPCVTYSAGAPRVDVKEEDNAYTLEMELPGRTEKDVNIELDHDNLTIASKTEETKETKEDKKDGTLGIRSIFESIHSGQVFTVVFKKQGKPKTKKQFAEERETQRATAVAMIDKAKRQKKSMATAYKEALEFIQDNPIFETTEGETRVLRGFKLQFVSRDGKYRCLDMDIERII